MSQELVGGFSGYGWGIRQVIGVLGFLAVANGYIQRFCLSLAITEMASQVHLMTKEDPNACPIEPPDNITHNHFVRTYLISFNYTQKQIFIRSFNN